MSFEEYYSKQRDIIRKSSNNNSVYEISFINGTSWFVSVTQNLT